MTYCTYIHRQKTDGKVFYVGAGALKRATSKNRSQEWFDVVANNGLNVEVCAEWATKDEAYEHEKVLIACFKGMNHPLLNKSIGGKGGTTGIKQSQDLIDRRMKAHRGAKRPEQVGKNISAATTGKPKRHKPYVCLDCGYVNNNGNMTQHQAKSNHVGKVQL